MPPLRAHNGPAGGLPRVLSGPSLGNGTRGELRMLADVRFVSRPVLSAPQNRSASLPRHLLSCCSSAPPPPSPAPPRARPFDPACRVKQLSICCFSSPYDSASCCCWCAGRGQGGGEARVAPPSRSSAPSGRRPAPALRPLPRACLSTRRCRSHKSIAGRLLPLSLLPCQPYNTDNDTVSNQSDFNTPLMDR